MYFEIVERASKDFPFYTVYLYDYSRYHGGSQNAFFVSQEGKTVFYRYFFGEKTPFKKCLEQKSQWAREYQKEATYNPNKFIRF